MSLYSEVVCISSPPCYSPVIHIHSGRLGSFIFLSRSSRVGVVGEALHRIDGCRLRENDFMEFLVKILAKALVARQGMANFCARRVAARP